MIKLSQKKLQAANVIETAFSRENIQGLLENLNIGTSRSINIVQEINHSPINQNILFKIPNEGCTGKNKILLNSKQGQATVDQVFDKPFCDLTGMPWKEKMHYARLLWSKFMQFQGLIEKALQDLKNNSEEINNDNTKIMSKL